MDNVSVKNTSARYTCDMMVDKMEKSIKYIWTINVSSMSCDLYNNNNQYHMVF